jgi:hypothetical protein
VPVLVSCGVTGPTATCCCSCLPLPFPSPPPLWCAVPPTFRRAACTPLSDCEVNTACTGAADGQRTCGNCANGFWEDDANNACTGRRGGACAASSAPPASEARGPAAASKAGYDSILAQHEVTPRSCVGPSRSLHTGRGPHLSSGRISVQLRWWWQHRIRMPPSVPAATHATPTFPTRAMCNRLCRRQSFPPPPFSLPTTRPTIHSPSNLDCAFSRLLDQPLLFPLSAIRATSFLPSSLCPTPRTHALAHLHR